MSTPFRLRIPRDIFEAMLAQAQAERPNECCGLLGGTRDEDRVQATRRYPLVNAAASPVRYEADAKGLLHAFRDMRERQIEHLAIYHSHPTSDPVPSRTDLAQAFYPGVVYFIISLTSDPPIVRGWWLSETEYAEAEWELEA